jgi:hypothetical protein
VLDASKIDHSDQPETTEGHDANHIIDDIGPDRRRKDEDQRAACAHRRPRFREKRGPAACGGERRWRFTPPSVRHAPIQRQQGCRKKGVLNVSAKTLKATIVLSPERLSEPTVPPAPAHRICGQHQRPRHQRTEHGAENVAVIAQGALVGEHLESAGVTAQPRANADEKARRTETGS